MPSGIRKLFAKYRDAALHLINVRRIAHDLRNLPPGTSLPVFVIASPRDMHLTPFFLRPPPTPFGCLVLANGLGSEEVKWLREKLDGVAVSPLAASVTGNPNTYLSHASVIQAAADAWNADFVIQDADCVVRDPSKWLELQNIQQNAYAAGPFWKPCNYPQFTLPDTFLVRLQWSLFKEAMRAWETDAQITLKMPPRLASALQPLGIAGTMYPDTDKKYFDTLQTLWLALELGQRKFQRTSGAGDEVFHVGGSSYLMENRYALNPVQSPWTAGTLWFHMAFIEQMNDGFLKNRFTSFRDMWKSSQHIAEQFPGFQNSQRHRVMTQILHESASS
jgi:hypothetical protein